MIFLVAWTTFVLKVATDAEDEEGGAAAPAAAGNAGAAGQVGDPFRYFGIPVFRYFSQQ